MPRLTASLPPFENYFVVDDIPKYNFVDCGSSIKTSLFVSLYPLLLMHAVISTFTLDIGYDDVQLILYARHKLLVKLSVEMLMHRAQQHLRVRFK